MRVQMLGTGSADGLPNPFCECATCADARDSGRTRAPSSALIDDVLLIDPGPGAGPAASRFGASLRQVEHVLITHGHPDHLAPEFLLWRSWIRGLHTLHIWGPTHAIERCTHWVLDSAPVQFHEISAGDTFTARTGAGDYSIRAIESAHGHGNGDVYAEECVLFDVTSPDGHRLFYATDTAPLPQVSIQSLRDRAFDLVLIEETFGHVAESVGHMNLAKLHGTMHELRGAGAVSPGTDVVAFHLSHHNPPFAELAVDLAAIGARAVDDGTVIDTRVPIRAREFVLGGVRSGKSRHAEARAAALSPAGAVTFVATGVRDGDDEWARRIALHQARRPAHWRTVETTDLTSILASAQSQDTLLIDCVGMWLTAQLDDTDAWSDDDLTSIRAIEHTEQRIDELVASIAKCPAQLVIVSNEVGQGIVPATASGRIFRDLLGIANTRIAAACTQTTFMVAGRALMTEELP